MITTEIPPFISLFLLAAIVISLWWPGKFSVTATGLGLFLSFALAQGYITLTGLLLIAGFFSLAGCYHWSVIQHKTTVTKISLLVAVLVYALILALNLLPGIGPIIIASEVILKPGSAPFTLRLNIGKIISGIVLVLLFVNTTGFGASAVRSIKTGVGLAVCAALIISPIGLAFNYLGFSYSVPGILPLWFVINLLFVCVAEEAFFRGALQTQITRVLGELKFAGPAAIILTSLLFGLAHSGGGMVLFASAFIASLFYGYSYARTRRIEAAIICHFMVNLIHMLLFTYPYRI